VLESFLKDVALKADTLEEFQANLIRSHAESVGQRVSRSVTKGAMVLLAHSLAQGLSGSVRTAGKNPICNQHGLHTQSRLLRFCGCQR